MSTLAEMETKPLLTIKEFYDALGGAYGINSLYAAANAGKLKRIKVGRKSLIPRTELTEFLKREAA